VPVNVQRRTLLAIGATAGVSSLASAKPAAAVSPFPHLEATIAQLQARLQSGRLTSRTLASAYLKRIDAIDRAGPKLSAVIEVNPDVHRLAAELDRERRAGRSRGPLHGIPVVIKDNIATADRMETTAGSLALLGSRPPRDAAVVTRLRAAGALILGKTNLSEWANIRSPRSTSGWSGRGGLTRNPFALDRTASGSSSGTAVAVSANLAVAGIGTETDGSIISPSSVCGIVGFKPTVGLVSRDGIIPISHSQDTAGPMTRSVADAALMLAAIAGSDPRDAATAGAPPPVDYAAVLDLDGLRGARIGVVRNAVRIRHPAVGALFDTQLAVLRAAGAELVDPVEVPNIAKIGGYEIEVLLTELKAGVNAYLAEFGNGAKVTTFADVIAFNDAHGKREMPLFGQEFFVQAQAKGDLTSSGYLEALANSRKYARTEGLDVTFKDHRVDALVSPTGGLAWLFDPINGDSGTGNFSSPAAVAGYPHITIPMGFVEGLPAAISFVGPAWSDATLLRYGHAYEQATRARRAPAFPRSVTPKV
jgi:amidase